MDDAIAAHYSQPQQVGGTFKFGRHVHYAVPLKRIPKDKFLEKTSGHDGSESNYKKLASQARTAQKEKRKKYSDSSEDSDSEDDQRKKKKKTKKRKLSKHKRSRIDDALGDDTY